MKRELDERIADWVDGRLSPRDQERLEAEFRVNSKLRAQAEEYRETVERVRRALAEPGEPVNLVDRVMERVQLDHARPGLGRALPFLASFAAAAAMILLFLALYRIEPAQDQSGPLDTAKAEADPDGEVASEMEALGVLREADELAAGPQGRDRVGGERVDELFTQAERQSRFNELPAKVAADEDARTGAGDKERSADLVGGTQAAGKAGAIGAGETREGLDRLESAAPGAPIPQESAEAPIAQASRTVPLSETAVWVQGVVGGVQSTVDGMDDIARMQRELERERLGQGLPPVLEDRANSEATTPVVVINLPPGQEREIGELEAPDPAAGRYRNQLQPQTLEQRLAELNAERRNAEANVELKDQKLQQTIDQALLPVSNALPAQVEEFDSNGLSTLQSAGSFAYRSPDLSAVSPERGFVSNLPGPVPELPTTGASTTGPTTTGPPPAGDPNAVARKTEAPETEPGTDAPSSGTVYGRAFRVQGDRQQVAEFLRQMSDWGRAKGAAVEVAELPENLVPQTFGPPPAEGSAQSRARQDAQRPANRALLGARGEPADQVPGEISVLLLFQSGAAPAPALKRDR